MARYTYRCPDHGTFDEQFALGEAPRAVRCLRQLPNRLDDHGDFVGNDMSFCFSVSPRYFGPDACPEIAAQDPFRRFDLSPRKEDAQVRQQRYLDAPRDRQEARTLEASRGITYVGDDTSGMTAGARRGIEKHRDRVKSGEVKT